MRPAARPARKCRRACRHTPPESCAARKNHRNGSRNATPISRPSNRWKYSHQKMPLNCSSDMPLFTCWYSGVERYFSNATSQSAAIERRQRAHDRLPLGDRKPGMRETGHASDHDHHEDQQANPQQPDGDRVMRGCGRAGAGARHGGGERRHAPIIPCTEASSGAQGPQARSVECEPLPARHPRSEFAR